MQSIPTSFEPYTTRGNLVNWLLPKPPSHKKWREKHTDRHRHLTRDRKAAVAEERVGFCNTP
jgi:hypothetical protein